MGLTRVSACSLGVLGGRALSQTPKRPAGEASPGPSAPTSSHACLSGLPPAPAALTVEGWPRLGALPA